MTSPDPLVDGYRANQATVGEHASAVAGAIWDRSFSIKDARASWETMRPDIIKTVNQFQTGTRAMAVRYYNARRLQDGLDTITPKTAPLADEEHIGSVIDPCGLGAFLHMVKQGALMEDAAQSARSSLGSAVQRLVLTSARQTLLEASKADPDSDGWSRITGGTCGYCSKLASQEGQNDGTLDFPAHDDCKCNIDPKFKKAKAESPGAKRYREVKEGIKNIQAQPGETEPSDISRLRELATHKSPKVRAKARSVLGIVQEKEEKGNQDGRVQ